MPPWGWVFFLSFWLEFWAWVLVFLAADVKKKAWLRHHNACTTLWGRAIKQVSRISVELVQSFRHRLRRSWLPSTQCSQSITPRIQLLSILLEIDESFWLITNHYHKIKLLCILKKIDELLQAVFVQYIEQSRYSAFHVLSLKLVLVDVEIRDHSWE